MSATLSSLATVRRGTHIGKKERDPEAGPQIHSVKVKSIVNGEVVPLDALDIAYMASERSAKHALLAGDVLIAVTGANPKVAGVLEEHAGCVANQGLAVLTPADDNSRTRILDYLRSEDGQAALRALQTGVTIPSIATSKLKGIEIP